MTMNQNRQELFTMRVPAGRRTYFFDVKMSQDGVKYLVISESRAAGDTFEHDRVMVFEENLESFVEGLDEALAFLGLKQKRSGSYSLDEIRKQHPRAYMKWTPDEEETLRAKFAAGASVEELARFFQRQPSAIRRRLEKLRLL